MFFIRFCNESIRYLSMDFKYETDVLILEIKLPVLDTG